MSQIKNTSVFQIIIIIILISQIPFSTHVTNKTTEREGEKMMMMIRKKVKHTHSTNK